MGDSVAVGAARLLSTAKADSTVEPLRPTSVTDATSCRRQIEAPIDAARGASSCSSPWHRAPLPLHGHVQSVSERHPDASRAQAEPRTDRLKVLREMRKSCSRRWSTAVQMCRVRNARAAVSPARPGRRARRVWRQALPVMGRQTTHMLRMLLRVGASARVPAVHSARARCHASQNTRLGGL